MTGLRTIGHRISVAILDETRAIDVGALQRITYEH